MCLPVYIDFSLANLIARLINEILLILDCIIIFISFSCVLFVIYVCMHDIFIFWSIIYAIISYLGLEISAVCS